MSCEHEFERKHEYCTFEMWRGTCRKCGVWGWRGFRVNKKWRPYKENPMEPRLEWQGTNPTVGLSRPDLGYSSIIKTNKDYEG